MKKRSIIAFILLILLTTITSKQKIIISKFNIKEIKIENNLLLQSEDIIKSLKPIYDKNLINLNYRLIEEELLKNTFVESFNIKKKYPNTLIIKIVEKKPIAILQNKKKKYFISDKGDLISYVDMAKYKDLPIAFGNGEDFYSLYKELKNIKFPLRMIKSFYFFESGRWDLVMYDEKVIKLPIEDYIFSLKNFLLSKDNSNFKNYKIFDYRIKDQLILN